jgi:signal transduction histidine kinase
MDDIVDDVLTLARRGDVVSTDERRPVDLATAVADAWETTETAAATVLIDSLPTIRADGTWLCRLLGNLFSNAVAHGGSDAVVRVEWFDDRDRPTRKPSPDGDEECGDHGGSDRRAGRGLAVEDDGPGVPPGDREQVFERGHSIDGDTGFGLAIVRRLAETHGWTVTVGEADAGGARFEVRGVETVPESTARPTEESTKADTVSASAARPPGHTSSDDSAS